MSAQILVVDDDTNTLDGYLDFLAGAGFVVDGAADGATALTLAFKHPPSAIVTDIELPGLDGFALAETLRDDPRTRQIPVLGLTGHWSAAIGHRATRQAWPR